MIFRAALTLASALAVEAAAADLRLEKAEDTLRVFHGDELLTAYRSDWRVPYLYPVRSLSGANLTRHWPADDSFEGEERDHPHHRSLWLAHGAVNGYDFWAFHDGKDAAIEHRGFSAAEAKDGTASFTAELAWTTGGKTHLSEKRTHVVRLLDDKTWQLDVTSELTAPDDDALFGDTKEGMFAIRLDRTLRVKGRQAEAKLVDSEGHQDGDVWGKRAQWIATHGPDEKDQPVVIAMFDHPENLRHPTWWHARDYGLLAANPFGIHDFENIPDKRPGEHVLKKGDTLVFRYRVVFHHGDMESAGVAERWNDFAELKTQPENP